jgi:acetyl esterase/lipase
MNRQEFLRVLAGGAVLGTIPRTSTAAPEPRTYTYKTAGGCEIHADVYGADANARKRGLIYIHGGALIGGSRDTLPRLVPDVLQKLDYLLVAIDYRLAPETKLPLIIDDVRDAVAWVRTEGPKLYNLNPDRLAIAGDSAGGYLTLMTGFCVTPRPTVLAVFWGYGDITSPWYSKPDPFYARQPRVSEQEARAAVGDACITSPPEHNQRGRFYLYCRQNGLWPKEVSGHDPDAESSWFDAYCPVRNVSREYPPTFLVHGTADTDVPCEESKKMADRMAHAGVEHRLALVPGGGHGLNNSTSGEMKPIYADAARFLTSHTG